MIIMIIKIIEKKYRNYEYSNKNKKKKENVHNGFY